MNKCLKEIQKSDEHLQEMNKAFKEGQGKKPEKLNEINKTVQDQKITIEASKRTQTERNLATKILEMQTVALEASFANRIQEIEERI